MKTIFAGEKQAQNVFRRVHTFTITNEEVSVSPKNALRMHRGHFGCKKGQGINSLFGRNPREKVFFVFRISPDTEKLFDNPPPTHEKGKADT